MLVYEGIYRWEGSAAGCGSRAAAAGCGSTTSPGGHRRRWPFLRPILVLVADVPESPLSVRSCAGHLATSIARDFAIAPSRMLYVEHVPESRYGREGEHVIPEEFVAVDFTWTEGGAMHPRWRTLQGPLLEAVRDLLATDAGPGGPGP
jgi:hypothetical protein